MVKFKKGIHSSPEVGERILISENDKKRLRVQIASRMEARLKKADKRREGYFK